VRGDNLEDDPRAAAEATFARLAGEAEKNCPVSKVLKVGITLDAKLI
jgi:organic hydroperoxide reductase OsmC/OhrA